MKEIKKIGIGILVLVIAIVIFGIYWLISDWTFRYHSELDEFFGKGNWEVVSEEVESEKIATIRSNSSWSGYGQDRRKKIYRNWNIMCTNKNGEEEIWKISDHTHRQNKERYSIISLKRYTAHQALILELMDISFSVVEEEVHNEIIKEGLTDKESECIYVYMSYNDGNPPRSFYDKLAKEPWFTIEGILAENYLATDLYDFYLVIGIHDYKLEKLTKQEQANVLDSLEKIENRLLEKYKDNASFEIIYGDYNVKYEDGVKKQ